MQMLYERTFLKKGCFSYVTDKYPSIEDSKKSVTCSWNKAELSEKKQDLQNKNFKIGIRIKV